MLPLNDPRWRDLDHRGWTKGAPYKLDPTAPFAPAELAKLVDNPSDIERFRDLWPYLCSEGTAWPASHAAVPYAVAIAKRLAPAERFEYLFFVGLVVICTDPSNNNIKPFLNEDYQRALEDALPLIVETLQAKHDVTETRYLLAVVAALKGHCKLAHAIEMMDCICVQCPKCGDYLYPQELQEALQ